MKMWHVIAFITIVGFLLYIYITIWPSIRSSVKIFLAMIFTFIIIIFYFLRYQGKANWGLNRWN